MNEEKYLKFGLSPSDIFLLTELKEYKKRNGYGSQDRKTPLVV